MRSNIQADEILYSPLVRAADTAKHISEMTGIPARPEPRLTEQNFGKWESTARDGADFKKAKECFAMSHEGGESTLRLAQRIYKNPMKKRIFSSHTTALRVSCSRIFTI